MKPGGRASLDEFNEYQDISGMTRDYLDINDGMIEQSVGVGRNQIKININTDKGILDDLSYFSQDLEELSQNNNMSLKFYDFNGFKQSMSHRGGSHQARPNESVRGKRERLANDNAGRRQPIDTVPISFRSNNHHNDGLLSKQEALKTTEERSHGEAQSVR